MNVLLAKLWANKHTSGAAIAYGVVAIACPLALIWFPEYKDKIDATRKILEGGAIAYGLLAAGDATAIQPQPPKP